MIFINVLVLNFDCSNERSNYISVSALISHAQHGYNEKMKIMRTLWQISVGNWKFSPNMRCEKN